MSETAEAPVDADFVEVHDPEPVAPAPTSMAVARRERRSEVIRPLDTDQLIESFTAYQELLPRLLDASDYQDAGKDKKGNPRRFVKKSGWRKIATAFDLDVQIIRSTIERDEHGKPARAEVWARAIAPSGRSMDGDGYCSVEEERFGKAGEEQWKIDKARAKLENDLRATATTRAMNRAISGLVGMGEVSAEEVDAGHAATAAKVEPASPELVNAVLKIIAWFVGQDQGGAQTVAERLMTHFDGELPKAAGEAIAILGRAVKDHRDAQQSDRAAA